MGTKAEWNSIYIKDDNDRLINATLHFIDDVNPQPTPQPNTQPSVPTPKPQPSTPAPQPQAPATQPSVPLTQPEQTTQPQSKPAKKPKSTKIKKAKGSKKAVAVEWAKIKGVKGYQVQVATDKKFKKNKKTVTIKNKRQPKQQLKNSRLRKNILYVFAHTKQ